MIKAHKIRLNPTPEQAQYFWQAAGVARFAWNWALGRYNELKAEGKKPKLIAKGDCLKKEFAALKSEQFPWVNEVTSYAYQGAFSDLAATIRMYYEKRKNGTLAKAKKPRKDGKPTGWPRFKSRERTTPAFYLANTCLRFDDHQVKIQKLDGWVDMYESLRFEGKVMGGRVSYTAGHWWLSVQVEVDHEPPINEGPAVGVDLGIKYLAVTSDGVIYENPKAFERVQRKLRRMQRQLDRQRRNNNPDNYNPDGTVKPGGLVWRKSANMLKTEQQIARLHYRAGCIRREAAHEMTTEISQTYGLIGIEDLNVRGMLSNGRLAKAVSDAALYEKRRQLEYKAVWNGGQIIIVDRWFPSSKTCNHCGQINPELRLSDRTWACGNCGQVINRDGNAAENIRDEALRLAGT